MNYRGIISEGVPFYFINNFQLKKDFNYNNVSWQSSHSVFFCMFFCFIKMLVLLFLTMCKLNLKRPAHCYSKYMSGLGFGECCICSNLVHPRFLCLQHFRADPYINFL